jgi:geranylgeranyl diphosphate synthase type I
MTALPTTRSAGFARPTTRSPGLAPPTTPSPAGPSTAPPVLAWASSLTRPALDRVVEALAPELHAPVRHHLGGGGKSTRAALVLVSAVAAGGSAEVGVVGAVALELVHNFSLLHDDIIDGDHERRHRPTVWCEFGVGPAIIAGDALATMSLQVLLEDPTAARVKGAARLAAATQEMIAGQADDMAFESRSTVSMEECLRMEAGKTGALLSCAAAMGAILAEAPEATVEALAAYGRHLGAAFQAVDDDLGIWGDPGVTGKPTGSDLRQHKKSLPVVAALAMANGDRRQIETLLRSPVSDEDVDRAAGLIEACGGRAAALEVADRNLERALAALHRVDLVASARSDLTDIARYVVGRDR